MNPKRVLLMCGVLGAVFAALASAWAGNQASAATPLISPAVLTSTPTLSPSPTACPPSWQIVNSPNAPGIHNRLFGVAAVSADDVWAVGRLDDDEANALTLILHWEGTQWVSVPVPQSAIHGWLSAVSVLSSDDIWAVGHRLSGGETYRLATHWDGGLWHDYPTPRFGSNDNGLDGWA